MVFMFVDIFATLSLPQRNHYFICYIWNNISYALPEYALPEFEIGRLFIFHKFLNRNNAF